MLVQKLVQKIKFVSQVHQIESKIKRSTGRSTVEKLDEQIKAKINRSDLDQLIKRGCCIRSPLAAKLLHADESNKSSHWLCNLGLHRVSAMSVHHF